MDLVAIASSGLIVGAIFLGRWAITGGNSSSNVRANLARPSLDTNPGSAIITLAGSSADRADRRGFGRLLASLTHGPGGRLMPKLGIKMAKAGLGGSWTVERMLALKLGFASAVLLPTLMIALTKGSVLVALLGSLLASLVYAYPDVRLTSIAKSRMREVKRQLPDILDRLTISMEAGLGFDTALAKVVAGRTGAGYEEFRKVQQDLQVGFPRDLALATMSERLPIQDLRLVLDAITQSGKYGLALTSVLRTQAEELRDQRKMRAQEQAMKVPVKILLPLIFCIFPALFVVLIGPALIKLSQANF
jgi:tight adherence protein C